MNFKYFLSLFLVISLSACVPIRYGDVETNSKGQLVNMSKEELPDEFKYRTDQLYQQLVDLDASIDPQEAREVADSTIFYAMSLAKEYELTWPPIVHNMLVNYGFRPRGLCIHWCYDILALHRSKNFKTMEFHWGVANEGNKKNGRFAYEHSSPVVTPVGGDFYGGIVLDAWRDSGELKFGKISDDKYDWQPFDESKLDVERASRMSMPGNVPKPDSEEAKKQN